MADHIQKSAGWLPHRFCAGHSAGDNCVTVSIDVRAHEIVKAAKENPELQYDVAQRVVLALQGQPLSAMIESTEVDPKLLELATNVAPVELQSVGGVGCAPPSGGLCSSSGLLH